MNYTLLRLKTPRGEALSGTEIQAHLTMKQRQTLAEHQEKHAESEINLAIGQFPTTVAAVLLPRLILNTPVGIIPIWAW